MHARIGFVEKDVAALERELAAIGHGVARVQGEVQDRRGELVRIDHARSMRHRRAGAMISICSPSVGCSSLAASSINALTSTSHRLQRLFAGEGEQMLGQVGAAFGGLVDQPGDGHELGLVGDGLFQNPDGAGDHGQDVVEVMRDAAGQLADRVHLLDLADLGVRGLLLGQIAADEEMTSDRLRPCSGPVQRHRPCRPCRCSVSRSCACSGPRRAARISLRVLSRSSGWMNSTALCPTMSAGS